MKVSSDILNLIPYKPGKPISETQREYGVQNITKLASNENPLGASPKAIEAMVEELHHWHRYPDPTCYELIGALEKKWKTPRNQIVPGNGSDELIDILVRIYCEAGDAILTSEAAFSAYAISAQAARVKTITTPMRKDYSFDLPAMAEVLKSHPQKEKIKLVFIANPNNPTGTYVNAKEVEEFLKLTSQNPDLMVIFDEAYNEFVRASDYSSGMVFRDKYRNVAVIRTLSKIYGLAGLRVGVLLADQEVIDLVNRVRKPFNVNSLAQVAALAALSDEDFLKQTAELTWQGLDYFYKELDAMGLPYIPSQGNFVMFDTLRDVTKVNEFLLRRGVILRPVLNYGFKTHLRMSVGRMSENEIAISALKEVLKEIKPV